MLSCHSGFLCKSSAHRNGVPTPEGTESSLKLGYRSSPPPLVRTEKGSGSFSTPGEVESLAAHLSRPDPRTEKSTDTYTTSDRKKEHPESRVLPLLNETAPSLAFS